MARISETFDFGSADITQEELLLRLARMYADLAQAINSKPDIVQRNTDGQPTDTFLSQGTFNINLTTNKVEVLTQHQDPTLVTWTQL